VPATGAIGPNVVLTGVDVRTIMGITLYDTVKNDIQAAQLLNQSISGNDLSGLAAYVQALWFPTQNASCPMPNDPSYAAVVEQSAAIRCVDADDMRDKDVEYWIEYANSLIQQSDILGQRWTELQTDCAGWPARPNWNFDGPFESPKPNTNGTDPTRPAAPIIFLSSQNDPVTPLAAARDMSKGHVDSRVLVVNATGHCGILSAPSKCRDGIVREYFDSGSVPEDQEVFCSADCGPWDPNCQSQPDSLR
jgi:pimeloyl-ACP methyl ester carboxylesterase